MKRFWGIGILVSLALTFGFGCGQQELERLKAENVKIKEQSMKLQKELETVLVDNAEMKAKLDKILGILVPPPVPEPAQEPVPEEGAAATEPEPPAEADDPRAEAEHPLAEAEHSPADVEHPAAEAEPLRETVPEEATEAASAPEGEPAPKE